MTELLGRAGELQAIERFLDRLSDGSGLLMLEGDAGIGKTTLLRSCVSSAGERGFRVLSCVGTAADARLSYSALADMLGPVEEEAFDPLPAPQRQALDAALLRGDLPTAFETDTDVRGVSAAALSVLRWLCESRPVVIAVDDLQWLDAPSRRVIEFCSRRLPMGAGLIASRRPADTEGPVARLAGLTDPARVEARSVQALPDEALRRLVKERAAVPVDRRLVQRIVDLAGGNPFYALELVRGLGDGDGVSGVRLPPSLSDMVSSRVLGLDDQQTEALLAVAAMAGPSVAVLSEALGADVVELLAEPERRGVVEVDGDRIQYSHPLLAEGIYGSSTSAARQRIHRKLSAATVGVEERARHLAAARMVPEALDALLAAAVHLRGRGAPDAAAEMLELAVGLGADARLVVRAAEHRFDAGDTRAAVRMLDEAVETLPAGAALAEALLLLGEIRYKDDSFPDALVLLERAQKEAEGHDRLLLMGDLRLAFTLYNLGSMQRAAAAGHAALERAERLGDDALVAQALAVTVIVEFSLGSTFDEVRLKHALMLQDPAQRTGAELCPELIAAFLYFWTGRFDEGRAHLDAVCSQYLERGEEQALAWASFTRVWLESAAGDVSSTTQAALVARERLLLLETVTARALAFSATGEAASYAGRHQEARHACETSLALFERSGWRTWSWFPRMTLGALELSQGNPAQALEALEPIIELLAEDGFVDPAPGGMLFAGDAVEAMIAVGRNAEAETIIDRLEERGRSLDRPWAIVVSARCRGLLLASTGDLTGAKLCLERAVEEHAQLAMPVEQARNLLALGRILRLQRRRRDARALLEQSRTILASVGARSWQRLVEAEIARLGIGPGEPSELTASEERVARLAARGLTNSEVAASLVISPKTVEAHLSRAYGKLGIRSRAELGGLMNASAGPPVGPRGQRR